MSWIGFIIIGGVAGWLAGNLMRGGGFGLMVNIIVGIIGAVIGGWGFFFFCISTGNGLIGNFFFLLGGGCFFFTTSRPPDRT